DREQVKILKRGRIEMNCNGRRLTQSLFENAAFIFGRPAQVEWTRQRDAYLLAEYRLTIPETCWGVAACYNTDVPRDTIRLCYSTSVTGRPAFTFDLVNLSTEGLALGVQP